MSNETPRPYGRDFGSVIWHIKKLLALQEA